MILFLLICTFTFLFSFPCSNDYVFEIRLRMRTATTNILNINERSSRCVCVFGMFFRFSFTCSNDYLQLIRTTGLTSTVMGHHSSPLSEHGTIDYERRSRRQAWPGSKHISDSSWGCSNSRARETTRLKSLVCMFFFLCFYFNYTNYYLRSTTPGDSRGRNTRLFTFGVCFSSPIICFFHN